MNDNNLIVSPEWLAANTENPQVVIVDCRFALADRKLGQKQYQESHIPGSFYLDLNEDLASVVGTHGGRHPLPNIAELANKFSAIGINSSETLVVAYDDSRLAFASRLWWLMRYMGHSKVALLDGGFSAWKAAGYPVTDTWTEIRDGKFVVQLQPNMAVDIEAVKERKDLPETVLVDSRESERYEGLREPIDPIAGHIPGAVNYPWQGVTEETGKVRSISEQKQRWTELEKAEEIIVYCGSGVTACVNLLSLEIAGIPDAKLYVGSWSDWCSYQL
ncbi:MAG: sulfurtransferase [Oscillatoriales cyanobacterium]|jgi:thiosulfate/3-mercaptopyruvate sulfurtransferase|nr:MAG: sulfurtransferase [Oscillatoriales cyanobacterium]